MLTKKVRTEAGTKSLKNLQRLLDGQGTKRSALSDKEKTLGSSKKNLSLETRDVLTKEDRSTKRNFKNFAQFQHTKEQQTNIT